jgi:hypothetical protein
MCSARLAGDCHCLRLNEVIICQEHVVLCIHITYHPQYDQTLELQVCFVSVFLGVVTHWHIVF